MRNDESVADRLCRIRELIEEIKRLDAIEEDCAETAIEACERAREAKKAMDALDADWRKRIDGLS